MNLTMTDTGIFDNNWTLLDVGTSDNVKVGKAFISDETIRLVVDLILNVCIQLPFRTFGIVANAINIVVFLKSGLDDGITVTFFALAVADFNFITVFLMAKIATMLEKIFLFRPYVRLTSLSFLAFWYVNLFFAIAMLLTAFAALQKCACVAIPFIFKNTFTRSRCAVVVLLIYGALFVWYLPWFITNGWQVKFDSVLNRSRLVLKLTPHWNVLYPLFRAVDRITIPVVSEIVVMISLLVLIYKLVQASTNRRMMTASDATLLKGSTGRSNTATMDVKELRVITSVTIVSLVFFITYLPDILGSLVVYFEPEYTERGYYGNLLKLVDALHAVLIIVNSSINIFVYYKYNSKYRRHFIDLFSFCPFLKKDA